MGLLDLLPEVLQNVVHQLISTADLGIHVVAYKEAGRKRRKTRPLHTKTLARRNQPYKQALKYRFVCPAFRDAIDHELITKWSMTALNRAHARRVVNKNASAYLLTRLSYPMDCCHRFIELVSQMVDYICKELNLNEQACLERVCDGFVCYFTSDRIRKFLWKMDPMMHFDWRDWYKLLAALVSHSCNLVEKLLSDVVKYGDMVTWLNHYSMTPLQFAIISNDERLFDITLRCCSGMKFKVDGGIGDFSHGMFSMDSALTEAIERENLYIVRRLVQYLVNFHTAMGPRYIGKGPRYNQPYDDWMTLAVNAGNHNLVKALIPLRLKGDHVFLCDHFTTACRIGNLDLISLITRAAEMKLDQKMDMPRHSPETLPLLYAVC
jgi:hypothetical protein